MYVPSPRKTKRKVATTAKVYLLVVTGEIRRAPAVYGRAEVLGAGDEDGTDDEEADRVAVMQAVGDVVVVLRA